MASGKSFPLRCFIYAQTVVIAAGLWFLTRHFYSDDAYISLRYARNLLTGHGLTWTSGERVEGYTNFLLILLEALLGWLGVNLVAASRLIGFAAFFGLVAVMCRITGQWPGRVGGLDQTRAALGALAVALVGSSLPLLAWCWGGLEGNLFALLLAMGIGLVLHMLEHGAHRSLAAGAGLAFALATLTRPEGLMLFGVSWAFLGIALFTSEKHEKPALRLLWMLFAYMAVFLPYTYWRISYFGDFLPNTYYAKHYGIAPDIIVTVGWFYLLQYMFMPPLLVLFAVALTGFAAAKGRLRAPLLYLLLLAGVFCAYIVSVGGDHMDYFRFMIPLIPILALLIWQCGLALLSAGKEKWVRDLIASLLLFSVFQFGLVKDAGPSAGALSGQAVSAYVNAHWPKGATIALNPVGALPYFAPDYSYIDMLGLTDRHIARRSVTRLREKTSHAIGHLKADGAYVLSRKPDYIILGMTWGDKDPLFVSDLEILQVKGFDKTYERKEVYIDPPPELMPALRQAEASDMPGLVLNEQGKLRFIYYRRKTVQRFF